MRNRDEMDIWVNRGECAELEKSLLSDYVTMSIALAWLLKYLTYKGTHNA